MTPSRETAVLATALAVVMTGSVESSAAATLPTPNPEPVSAAQAGQRDTNRPNILVIMTDDQRRDELGRAWMKRTRNLIANKGVRFPNSFASTPLCAPARASFLSGKYTHNHGVFGVAPPFGFKAFQDRGTLPVWLRRAGYNTIYLGKYINRYGRQKKNGQREKYVPPGWTDWRASLDSRGTYQYFNTHLSRDGKRIQSLRGEYQTKAYGRIGRNIIQKYSGRRKPFFLKVSFTAPHHGKPKEADDPKGVKTPARNPKTVGKFKKKTRRLPDRAGEPGNQSKPWPVSSRSPLTKKDRRKARKLYRQRAQALSSVDRQVQRMIRTLRRQGELKRTYVIFTSDNGYLLGEQRRIQGKALPYRRSLTTPLAIRGPGIPRGKTRRAAFSTVDFAPTIAKMARAKIPKKRRKLIDGKSMLKAAKKGGKWKRPILTSTGAPKGKKRQRGVGIRVPGYQYAQYRKKGLLKRRELYHMRRDPKQSNNVSGHLLYRYTERRLRKILRKRRDCVGIECRRKVGKYER